MWFTIVVVVFDASHITMTSRVSMARKHIQAYWHVSTLVL